jgi:hypothetical protein
MTDSSKFTVDYEIAMMPYNCISIRTKRAPVHCNMTDEEKSKILKQHEDSLMDFDTFLYFIDECMTRLEKYLNGNPQSSTLAKRLHEKYHTHLSKDHLANNKWDEPGRLYDGSNVWCFQYLDKNDTIVHEIIKKTIKDFEECVEETKDIDDCKMKIEIRAESSLDFKHQCISLRTPDLYGFIQKDKTDEMKKQELIIIRRFVKFVAFLLPKLEKYNTNERNFAKMLKERVDPRNYHLFTEKHLNSYVWDSPSMLLNGSCVWRFWYDVKDEADVYKIIKCERKRKEYIFEICEETNMGEYDCVSVRTPSEHKGSDNYDRCVPGDVFMKLVAKLMSQLHDYTKQNSYNSNLRELLSQEWYSYFKEKDLESKDWTTPSMLFDKSYCWIFHFKSSHRVEVLNILKDTINEFK